MAKVSSERQGKLLARPNVKSQKGKDLKTLCSGMIRNAMSLKLQRGWSTVIRILLMGKIFIHEEKKRTWKTYHEKLLNTEFAWDRNSLFQADTITIIPYSIDKDMVRESISKKKNRKAAGLSGVVSEMVKTAGEDGKDSRRSRS